MVQCTSMWYDQIVPGQDLFFHSRSNSSSSSDDDDDDKDDDDNDYDDVYLLISVVFFCGSVIETLYS
jgi:hypothetical protein